MIAKNVSRLLGSMKNPLIRIVDGLPQLLGAQTQNLYGRIRIRTRGSVSGIYDYRP